MMSCCFVSAAEREREIFMCHVICERNDMKKSCMKLACREDAERVPVFVGWVRGATIVPVMR